MFRYSVYSPVYLNQTKINNAMSQELNSLNVDPSEGKKFRVKQQNVRLFLQDGIRMRQNKVCVQNWPPMK